MRRDAQPIRRKCSRRKWLSYCAFIARKPRANLFFELVMVPQEGVCFDARMAWEVATSWWLRRTRCKPSPTRPADDDDLPW